MSTNQHPPEPGVPPRRQCAKCPWKVGVDPRDIPGGYCETKHAGLAGTIAGGAGQATPFTGLRIMACHETPLGAEKPCVGWLVNQLGVGNNLALRLRAATGDIDANVETDGEQHERFEDTLPRPRRRSRR
jgi:hypothetical protein